MIMILIIVSLKRRPLTLDGQLSATCLFSLRPRMYEADHVVLGAAC
jgi:hypothetical protein